MFCDVRKLTTVSLFMSPRHCVPLQLPLLVIVLTLAIGLIVLSICNNSYNTLLWVVNSSLTVKLVVILNQSKGSRYAKKNSY